MTFLYNRISTLALIAFLHIVCLHSVLHGAASTRTVYFNVLAKNVLKVRNDLRDPVSGSKLETMDALLKMPGITVLADFHEADPWHGERVELSKYTGAIKSDGEVLDLGVRLETQRSEGLNVRYDAEITVPTTVKGARCFQALGFTAVTKPDAWCERACWGDGERTWMMWEYSALGDPPQKLDLKSATYVKVEMQWFQASVTDVAKLAESKPDTREKAMQWLTERAKLWREVGYDSKLSSPGVWQMSQGKHDPEKGAAVSDERFIIQTECQEEGGKFGVAFSMTSPDGKKEKVTTLKADMIPETWEFFPLEGNAKANVVACRVSRL
jgi:hypothetical protein